MAASAAKAASGSEAESAAESAENKRYRQAIDDVADVYVCPITAELPIDPVTAEDGRCYERWAIEEWFAKAPNQFQGQVKSPVTSEMMGKRLVPAVQVRNTLKRLVETGVISGALADTWKKDMAKEEDGAGGENKRYRQDIDDVADVYVCPITAELPVDPVTAEDGRCYERHAIEEWFARQPEPQVRSPVTNEPMGKRLLPAVQVRNTLRRLVESGVISGSKADAWKKAMAEEAERWKKEEERCRPGGEGFHEAKSRFEESVAESAVAESAAEPAAEPAAEDRVAHAPSPSARAAEPPPTLAPSVNPVEEAAAGPPPGWSVELRETTTGSVSGSGYQG